MRKSVVDIFSRAAFAFDHPDDLAFAQAEADLDCVHVFAENGTGIRAASGYAPGHKLAVARFGRLPVRAIVERCTSESVRTAVFHGYVDDLPRLARALHAEGLRCLALWHGATTQLFDSAERATLSSVLALRSAGIVSRVGAVKPGFGAVSPLIEDEPVLNFPPRVAAALSTRAPSENALLPMPSNWVKNLHTNLYAAAAEPRLRRLIVTRAEKKDFDPALLPAHVSFEPAHSRAQLFALMNESDVVLNASLTECQPMVALEAAAHGAPCLVPIVGLFDAHPYVALCTVADPTDVRSVRRTLAAVLDERHRDAAGLRAMQADFLDRHLRRATQRFGEWLAAD